MLPQVGAEVPTWRVVGGGRCETGVAAGWQRGRLEQQERAAGRGPSPTKCWPESRREEEGAWQLQPHTNPPIDWIPPGLRVTMSRQSRSTRQPQQPRGARQRLPRVRDAVEVVGVGCVLLRQRACRSSN